MPRRDVCSLTQVGRYGGAACVYASRMALTRFCTDRHHTRLCVYLSLINVRIALFDLIDECLLPLLFNVAFCPN